jgi:Deoxyribonuclease NucA/NucB
MRLIVLVLCAAVAAVAVAAEVDVPGSDAPRRDCVAPERLVAISFSATKYPNVRRHFRAAVARGWPRTLVLNRDGADERRERLLESRATRPGMDRDEYPPAVGRDDWRADVAYVPSAENRSHGATLGLKLRRFCDGTRFRYVFY